MDWLVILEIAMATFVLAFSLWRTIIAIKEGKLLPIILEAIEEAETQDGLTGEAKLDYAIEYITREATTEGIAVDIKKTVKMIEKLVGLTKKVNIK